MSDDKDFTLSDVRAAVKVLEANKLVCACGYDGVGWLGVVDDGESGWSASWKCPECGALHDAC